MELEGKHDRERGDNYHDRDIDGGEGELGKPRELIAKPRANRRIVGIDKKDPVREPTDQHRFNCYELDQ